MAALPIQGPMARRIVSLAPSCTETAFALGLGDEVVGVSTWCDTPAEAQALPKVGGFIGIDARKVLDLKPTLVLASSTALADQGRVVEQCRQVGAEVHVMYPRDVGGVLHEFLRLGMLTGRTKEASALIDATRARIEAALAKVPEQGPKPRVYYEEWPTPLMTVAEGIWIHDMLEMAGGSNVFAGAGSDEPRIAPEEVVARDPEVVLLGWCGARGREPASPHEVLQRPGWATMAAAKAGRVHVVDDSLFTRPGPRIAEGMELLARLLHPGKV